MSTRKAHTWNTAGLSQGYAVYTVGKNLLSTRKKRKAERAARNLDTIQRMVLALIAVWKNRRKKISDKRKGTAEIMRELSVSFTKVLHFLTQK